MWLPTEVLKNTDDQASLTSPWLIARYVISYFWVIVIIVLEYWFRVSTWSLGMDHIRASYKVLGVMPENVLFSVARPGSHFILRRSRGLGR